MKIWPLTAIDRIVDGALSRQAEAHRAELERIKSDSEQYAVARAAEAMALMAQPKERPAVYNFDVPSVYAQHHSTRTRPKSRIDLDTLRRLAATYDPMRACIQHLKTEVSAVPGKISPRDAKDDSEGSKRSIKEMTNWFSSRDGGLGGFGRRRRHFEDEIFEDALVIGAYAAHVEDTRGGTPYQVNAIDSATIRPKVDSFGWMNPDDAYEQQVMGVVVRPSLSMRELVYDGMHPVSWQPYFISPVEWLIGVVISALKADEWNRAWLTDGNVPDQLIAVPKEWTPEQMQAYSGYFDAILAGNGDLRERRKAKIVPDGTKPVWTQTRKDADFQEFELWLLRRTCAIFGVQPASIGFAGEQYKVSQEGSMKQTTQFGVGRLLELRKDLYDELLERHGYSDLEWKNVTEGEEEPSERATRLQVSDWMTDNEKRQECGLEPIGGGDDLPAKREADQAQADRETAAQKPQPTSNDPKKRVEDLKRWETKASRLLPSPAGLEFTSEFIDEETRLAIAGALTIASTPEEIRAAFAPYRGN